MGGETELPVGAEVVLRGLKAKPELNGTTGKVEGFNAESGRYTVELPDGSQYNLKPANLTEVEEEEVETEEDSLVGKEVVLRGIKAKPELNGTTGTVESFIAESGRYLVELPDGSRFNFKPANLAVAEATPGSLVGKDVVLHGLKSKPELNGDIGKAISFSEVSGRYVVEMSDEVELALKTANLSVATEDHRTSLEEKKREDEVLFEKLMKDNEKKAVTNKANFDERIKSLVGDKNNTVDANEDEYFKALNAGNLKDCGKEFRQLGWGAKRRIKP
jgi:hypothetical protein